MEKGELLTEAQQRILDEIKSFPGGHLRKHWKNDDTVVYRLMDKDINPIKNLSYGMVNKLIEMGFVKRQGDVFVLVQMNNQWNNSQ